MDLMPAVRIEDPALEGEYTCRDGSRQGTYECVRHVNNGVVYLLTDPRVPDPSHNRTAVKHLRDDFRILPVASKTLTSIE
jgi:hypothetical protein